jgi:hypothetical protein
VDSYSHEPYDPNNHGSNGHVASNGNITMVGTSDIWGDARPGVDGSFESTPNADVHGWAAPLTAPLSFPPVTVPAGVPSSGRHRIK